MSRRSLTAGTLALLAGCAGEIPDAAPCGTPSCFTERYFGVPAGAPVSTCAPASRDRLDVSLDVVLMKGDGVDEGAVVQQASRLQRFFRPYSLIFATAGPAAEAGLSHALGGSPVELDDALARAGLSRDRPLTDDEQHRANRAVGPVIFAALRRLVLDHARPHTVNVVVVAHVMAPALSRYLFGGPGPTLVGFGISPALFGQVSAGDPQQDLWEMTGLQGAFTPTLFIGDADLGSLPGSPDNLIAHELGHALGLPHSTEPGNLMTPGQNRSCDEPLSTAQLEQIRLPLSAEEPRPWPATDWIGGTGEAAVNAWQRQGPGGGLPDGRRTAGGRLQDADRPQR